MAGDSYTVYALYLSRGGKWELYKTFEEKEVGKAVAAAKAFDSNKSAEANKLVCEKYVGKNSQETLIYCSPHLPEAKTINQKLFDAPLPSEKKKAKKKKPPPKPAAKPVRVERPTRPKRNYGELKKNIGIALRSLMVMCLALGAAAAVTAGSEYVLAAMVNKGMFERELSDPDIRKTVATTIFLLAFIQAALPLARRFLPEMTFLGKRKSSGQWVKEKGKAFGLFFRIIGTFGTAFALGVGAAVGMDEFLKKMGEKGYFLWLISDPTIYKGIVLLAFLIVFSFVALPLARKFLSDIAMFKPRPKKPKAENYDYSPPEPDFNLGNDDGDKLPDFDLPEEKPPEPEDASPKIAPHIAEEAMVQLTTFAKEAVDQVAPGQNGIADSFKRFGASLFIYGAGEALAAVKGLDNKSKDNALEQSLKILGLPASMCGKFVDSKAEYRNNPKYANMIKAGIDAMAVRMKGDAGAARGLKFALENWEAKSAVVDAAPITVMFTDMVDSTQTTQILGDQKAQELVRRHNSIVRDFLRKANGREIKHTGDGIMACYPSAEAGIRACLEIQKAVIAYNALYPDLQMHLRIGLNTGNAIVEENDLFGAVVQMSARVCSKAATDQVWCSQTTKDAAANSGLPFKHMGDFTLKGFKDKAPLYEIPWS